MQKNSSQSAHQPTIRPAHVENTQHRVLNDYSKSAIIKIKGNCISRGTNVSCSKKTTPTNPECCWFTIADYRLSSKKLQGHVWLFYILVKGQEYFFSVDVKLLKEKFDSLPPMDGAKSPKAPRHCFYINYLDEKIYPTSSCVKADAWFRVNRISGDEFDKNVIDIR